MNLENENIYCKMCCRTEKAVYICSRFERQTGYTGGAESCVLQGFREFLVMKKTLKRYLDITKKGLYFAAAKTKSSLTDLRGWF
ncbi:hypothetical protein [Gaoshiqia sp. Z1-71]|uniref:hypothetical protein n=1 Tax=Gaoshiqia hydrogeniformans TaxID=3290090 RepID=UPI003BF7947C